MKKIILLSLIFVVTNISAQQLTVRGCVFEENNNEYIARVPFATVCYYNYSDTSKIEFIALTNMSGQYEFYNMKNGKYIVKINALGYHTKRQEVEFRDVQHLARNNNNTVAAHIAIKKEHERVNPKIFKAEEFIVSDEETFDSVVKRLESSIRPDNEANNMRPFRFWIGGVDIDNEAYKELKDMPFKKVAREMRDRTLKSTYIEYYDLSEIDAPVHGVFNIVFNNTSRRPTEKSFMFTETTDFFIR